MPFIRHVELAYAYEHALTDWSFPAARLLTLWFQPPIDTAATARIIIDALARCGSRLEAFHLSLNHELPWSALDGHVLRYLAYRAGLRRLSLGMPLTTLNNAAAAAARMQVRMEQPFQNLEQLEVRLASEELPSLMALLTGNGVHLLRLQVLELLLSVCTGPVLRVLSPLQHSLRVLLIEAKSDLDTGLLDIRDIRSLAAFVHLRMLQITNTSEGRDYMEDHPLQTVSDSDVLHVVKHMRHLHALILDFECQLSPHLLVQLGSRCPHLAHLMLPAAIDYSLVQAARGALLFPHLEQLGMAGDNTATDRYVIIQAFAALNHDMNFFPRLRPR
jgi:hypothetical protein